MATYTTKFSFGDIVYILYDGAVNKVKITGVSVIQNYKGIFNYYQIEGLDNKKIGGFTEVKENRLYKTKEDIIKDID